METQHVGDTRNCYLFNCLLKLKKLQVLRRASPRERSHVLYCDKLQSTEVCNTTRKPRSQIWVQDLFALLSFSLVSANFYLLTSSLNCAMEVSNLFVFYSCPQLRVKRDFGLWTLVTVGTVTILWTLEVELNVFHTMSNTPEFMRDKTTTKKVIVWM